MRRNRDRNNKKKEKMIMLMSSVFVLSALTVTGVYVRDKNEAGQDGYIVDLSEMNKQAEDKTADLSNKLPAQAKEDAPSIHEKILEDDLDYDPNFTEANSGQVENPTITGNDQLAREEEPEEPEVEQDNAEETEEQEAGQEEASAVNNSVAQAISFGEKDGLQWPIVGNVLLNYSMDKTIYFPTLQQYKYNPAIVIEAQQGENITAAASGQVVSVYQDAEIGQAIVMDLGNGYELTYGQLENITVKTGDYVSAGTVLATVAEPTKYYSVEGCNVYFKLTKDGIAVNPLGRLS